MNESLSFAKIPSALKALTFLSQGGSLGIHDGSLLLHDRHAQIGDQGSTRFGPGKPGMEEVITAPRSPLAKSFHRAPAGNGTARLP
jgi:hypothetical protein